ncbi:glycosyltransferase family 4 protein [Halalkalibaculum sp. DA384]|uniref:glycosyltransferase family 4 protein n=1 Tax=Halalkalibaculum sp. DA384 TaxID=3373606 RepID=UPI003754BF1C
MSTNDNNEMSKNIVFISEGINAPSSRFRVDPIAERLSKKGWNCQRLYRYGRIDAQIKNKYLQKGYRACARIITACQTALITNADLVFVQRLSWPWSSLPEQLIAKRGIPVVFDFDDAIFLNGRREKSPARQQALQDIYQASSLTIAGNEWLAKNSTPFTRTEVIPTCIDVEKYSPAVKKKHKNDPVIGWMGTSSNYVELQLVVDAIKKLRKNGHQFTFRIVSDLKNDDLIRELDAEFEYWSDEKELEQLQSFDIGLMPLRDIDWTKGKCSFKIIQYMAVGVPAVASDVGFNKEVVTDQQDGLLVSGSRQWYEALSTLLTSADLREKVGDNARNTAVQRFSVSNAAEKYDHLFRELV